MSHYFGASLHERESLVLQAPLKSLERRWCTELSFFYLLFQCRRARFESKFISRMRFYHLDFVLLIFIELVIFICLSVFNPIWSFSSFPFHLAKVDWQKHVPFSRPWNWLSSRKLPGIVFPFPTTLNIYLISRHCFSFPYHPGNLSYFQAFSDQGTANSGCNGDATLKSVFNFWKNQVTRWSLSADQVVRWPGDLFLLVFLTPTC